MCAQPPTPKPPPLSDAAVDQLCKLAEELSQSTEWAYRVALLLQRIQARRLVTFGLGADPGISILVWWLRHECQRGERFNIRQWMPPNRATWFRRGKRDASWVVRYLEERARGKR